MKNDENPKNNHVRKAEHGKKVLKTRQRKERENGQTERRRERIEAFKTSERARKRAQKTGNEWLSYMLSLQRGR